MNSDYFKLTTSELEVTVKNRVPRKISNPELTSEAVIALISSLDVKEFAKNEVQDKFDIYIEKILESIHDVCEWAGWIDRRE